MPADAAMFPLIIATGPLTSDALSADIAALVGGEHLYFYDAISPIVLAESIDMDQGVPRVALGPQPGGPTPTGPTRRARRAAPAASTTAEGDYLNCPMTAQEYDRFYDALTGAESATVHDFDKEKFFEGCLPIEVMAHRGRDTLRFGPMKPVGLVDPRTGRTPYAVVQLRQDNLAGDHFSLVGFQTQTEVGRAGARAADDPGPGAGRVRPLRHGAPQHLHQRPDRAARDLADEGAARPVLRRPDLRASKATSSRRPPA